MKTLLYIVSLLTISESTNVLRPRGISFIKSSLYDPAKPFTCFDGTKMIPFHYINDDYCDCKDGSDEPGTNACVNGTFYCNNIGHEAKYIPSAWVNDGICDCCDASDEYNSMETCINDCEELGKAARIEAELKEKEQLKGYNIRQQMAEEGLKLKLEKQARTPELEKEKDIVNAAREEKLKVKEIIEAQEKEALEKYREIEEEMKRRKEEEQKIKDDNEAKEAFNYLDSDKDGIIHIDEIRSRIIFDANKDGGVSEDEAKVYLNQAESLSFETFLESGWALIKPAYRFGKNMFTPPITELPTEEAEFTDDNVEDQTESSSDSLEFEDPDEQDYGEDYEDEEVHTQTPDPVTEQEGIQYDTDTQILIDAANKARAEYNEEDKRVREISKEIKKIEDELQKDFGPNEEFRPLAANCFEFNEREYTYKLCPFDYASQKQRDGSTETRLGTWGEWIGPEGSHYSAMKYVGGQACWNGPQRSTEVRLSCSTEVALTAVSEPNRCEYLFLLSTPSICTQPSQQEYIHQHTEL